MRNDIELNEYMKIHYPSLSYNTWTLNRDRSGYEAGRAAGSSVQFRSGIGAGGSTGPKLLKG